MMYMKEYKKEDCGEQIAGMASAVKSWRESDVAASPHPPATTFNQSELVPSPLLSQRSSNGGFRGDFEAKGWHYVFYKVNSNLHFKSATTLLVHGYVTRFLKHTLFVV